MQTDANNGAMFVDMGTLTSTEDKCGNINGTNFLRYSM